jgi:hypothetical protein
MHQNLWKSAPIKAKGSQPAPHRAFWAKFLGYPVGALGILMTLMALRPGVSHAVEGHAWQKKSYNNKFSAYSAAHSPKWGKPLTTLTSDYDDDEDDNGDDYPYHYHVSLKKGVIYSLQKMYRYKKSSKKF